MCYLSARCAGWLIEIEFIKKEVYEWVQDPWEESWELLAGKKYLVPDCNTFAYRKGKKTYFR